MFNLDYDPRIIGFIAFLGGMLFARLFSSRSKKSKEKEATDADRMVRGLEADLRVANKTLKKSEEKLDATKDELKTVSASMMEVQNSLDERTKELEETQELLSNECRKTNSLREDLSGRAEETIRAEVHARQVETELSVLKAGTSAVHEEVDRLAAERQELTGRVRQLEDEFLSPEALLDEGLKDQGPRDEGQTDEPVLDEPLVDF